MASSSLATTRACRSASRRRTSRRRKTLEKLSFDFQPKLAIKLVKTLTTCDFVERNENVILVGQPGTCKTHLSIALGIKACELGYDVRFTTVQELAARLRGAHVVAACLARVSA